MRIADNVISAADLRATWHAAVIIRATSSDSGVCVTLGVMNIDELYRDAMRRRRAVGKATCHFFARDGKEASPDVFTRTAVSMAGVIKPNSLSEITTDDAARALARKIDYAIASRAYE